MASPRVFVSSTCYDLADERDGLIEFCNMFGFDITLSERGDIFYHPDLHTHESCVRETGNCQLLILIIGGRFGGKYKVDQTKSITNAEYSAAVNAGIPIFTFVKQDVLNDHNVWQTNKEEDFSNKIKYPSIDNQNYAMDIFKFIDNVRHAPQNNGIFGFKFTRDIFGILRKQLAGMFYDFLQSRTFTKQMAVTNTAVVELTLVSKKIEELVKGVYKNVDSDGAQQAIDTIENESLAESFFIHVAQKTGSVKLVLQGIIERTDYVLPPDWWTFLDTLSIYEIIDGTTSDGSVYRAIKDVMDSPLIKFAGKLSEDEQIELNTLDRSYQTLLELPENIRKKIISKYLWTRKDAEKVRNRYIKVEKSS